MRPLRLLPSLSILAVALIIAVVGARGAVAAAVAPASGVQVDDPAVMGQWGDVMPWPDKAVHSVMLHTGKVLWYRGESTNATFTWDPITNQIQSQPFFDNIFCSGQSVMPDGRVLVTGGRLGTTGSLGPKHSFIFDPVSETWTRGPDMGLGRYYPTNLLIGDGRTLVFSGYDDTHTVNETVESFKPGTGPGGTDQWELLPGANRFMAYYPRFHLLSSGKVVHVGKAAEGAILDPVTQTWQPIDGSNYGSRAEGTSVLLPPGFDKIMIMGGGSNTNTAEIIDLAAPAPTWRYTAPMAYGRSHLNNLILPDGTVLVSGGGGSTPVYPAELFDPLTETWREMASMHTHRLYHSSAVLLPDGRCLWAGTDDNHTGEVYSPPYLFRGARPTIGSVPNFVNYGQGFALQTPEAASIRSVVLIRPSATTHSQNMDQRYVPLNFTVSGGTLNIGAPTNPNIAPPGYYMLFILNGDKVPSVARFVKLGGDPPPSTGNRAPAVNAGLDRTIRLPSTATLTGLVSDEGLVNPTPTLTWSKATGPGTVTFGNEHALTTTASFSDSGTYVLRLAAFDGELTGSDAVTITVRLPCGADESIERRVAAGADDAEENAGGTVVVTGNDLELVFDANLQTVGLRFTGNDIPQGSVITNAYLQFVSQEVQSEPTALRIYAQDADSAAAFTTATGNVSSRPRTDAFTTWTPASWTTVGAAGFDQRTPDLADAIQEVVDRPGWQGTSLALIITGTGHRTARSFETLAASAPLLHIDYVCGSTNRRPVVDAGPEQAITYNPVTTVRPTASLAGRATDDGLPAPPARVVSTWRQVGGPAGVSFADSLSPVTTASFPGPGTYDLSLSGYDGRFTTTDRVTIRVRLVCGGEGVVDNRVAAGADDAEESASGSVVLTGTDLELVFDANLQTVGLRFAGIDIQRGAVITNAYLQFTSQEIHSEATALRISGHDADSAAVFTTATRNVSSRPRTDASTLWTPAPWTAVGLAGPEQRTPDLSAVIQEIIDRPGWMGRSLALVITGTGHRTAKSFELLNAAAPLLHIEYGCAGTNRRPVVDAGADQTTLFDPGNAARQSASLSGRVTDDGLPNPPASVTSTWRQVSGPPGVIFGNPLALNTTATFPAAGTYELSLTGSDGTLSATDLVTITARSCEGVVERRISLGTDDAEEKGTTVLPTDSDLELVFDGSLQTVGLRFTGVDLLPGALITSAYVQLMADEVQSEATTLRICGQDADTAATFTTATGNISTRPRTDAFATWTPAAWATVGVAGPLQRTPDLSAVIQEIVDRPGWQGRSLALIVTGTGHRTAKSFEGLATGAALLHVEYACGSNRRPVVDAGPDQNIVLENQLVMGGVSTEGAGGMTLNAVTANLSGRVSDDGLPSPPGRVTSTWRQVSGPALATFGDSLAAVTTVSFPVNGSYELSLTGFDGELSTTDRVLVTLTPRSAIPVVVDRAITVGSDDAEESASGSVALTGSDLEMMIDGSAQRAVGLRFPNLGVPPGANVSSAWVQFKAKEAQSEATTLTVRAQTHDNAPAFAGTSGNLSTRPLTTAAATWPAIPAWVLNQATTAQRTTDLKDVIQEIVSRPGWASGNALALIVTGTGHRTAHAFENGAANAAVLHIEFTTGPVPNRAPIANAGPDTTVMLTGAAFLHGTLVDDRLPAAATLAWRKVAGPGAVSFDSPFAPLTRATFGAAGPYALELMATDGQYESRDTVRVTVMDPSNLPTTVEARVPTANDDVEETAAGGMSMGSSDLEMMIDGSAQRAIGLRFVNLAIPARAIVSSAWVQFVAREAQSEATSLTVRGHAVDNAPAFASVVGNVSTRPATAAVATWPSLAAWTAGQVTAAQRTPELKDVIQEIVGRTGWTSGNAIVLVVTGTGHRTANAFESGAATAALLHVEYLTAPPPPPPVVNQAPVVNAGPDTTVMLSAAAWLHGSVVDDGLPSAATLMWTRVSGPGTVTFDAPAAAVTRATFGAAGLYGLELMAMDGQHEDRDTVSVLVTSPPPVNQAPVVNAGPDTTVMLADTAGLHGSIVDDGLPTPATLMWRRVSGPGTVSFDNPLMAVTRASFGATGSYGLELMATDGQFESRDTVSVMVMDPTPPPPAATTVEVRIATDRDDVEETPTGGMSFASGDLEMVIDGLSAQRAVGLRFVNLAVPPGAIVSSAWVQFKAREAQTEATTLAVRAETSDNAPAFVSVIGNVTNRPLTTARATWSDLPAWSANQATAAQRTPELKDVVQEIVSRPGWASGNAVVIVVTGTGHRTAYAFEGGAANAALLHVEYTTAPPPPPPVVNQAPTADAGPDTTILLGGAAFLHGHAADDGLPGPMMAHWTAVSGPGAVTFDDLMSPVTRATFAAAGTYRLELMAMDGALETSDTVAVTVTEPALPPANHAPEAALAVLPAQGVAPLTVTADASSSTDPDGDALTYAFDFGDAAAATTTTTMTESCALDGGGCCCAPGPCSCGHAAMTGVPSTPTSTHSYAAGTWTVRVIVSDAHGASDTASAVVNVSPNLVTNPSFETALTGWNANGTGATVARVAGGHDGAFCVEARGDASLVTFGINDSPNVVNPVAGAGVRYRYSAWVRSAIHTGKAQLRIREYLNSVQQGAQILSPTVDLAPTWKLLTVDVVTSVAGSTLDLQVIDKPVVNGEVFQVDDITVHRVPPTAALLSGGVSIDANVPVAAAPAASALPAVTRLAAVFPNPSSGAATVRFELAREAQVEIDVYDLRGARVRRITSGRRNAGIHSETWDGRDQLGRRLPIGLYLVRFDADRHHESRKLVLTN